MEAERRQVVILFADMVGFTAASERLGEEAAFGLVQSLSQIVERAVQAEGARIHNIVGDGIMVAFGAPAALEDAPLRACRAALAILANLKASAAEIEAKHGARLEVRIGLNAGPAVFGRLNASGEAGMTVLGDAVNVAARLQALAEPGTAVVSEAVYRLAEGQVEATFAGERPIKGRAASEKVYRLDGIRGDPSRFAASLSRGLTAFVGRDRELETLEKRFAAIASGVHAIDIVGEPGIGKSRLLHEFRAHAAGRRALLLAGACSSDGRRTPFRAFLDIVRASFRIAPGDDQAAVKPKLHEGLSALALESDRNLGLLLNLLGHEPPPGALAGLDGVLIGLRTRELLRRTIQARARLAPLVLMIEDIHWLDSASEALLGRLIAIRDPLPLLILHTRRPDYAPPWAGNPAVTRLSLDPLSERETSRIAEARLGVKQLPEALGALIAAKAEGNALFAEEIASFLLERGVLARDGAGVSFDPAAVTAVLPDSVRSILASRVDQLPREARGLLQTAAVIGRRFDPHLVLAVTDGRNRQGASFAAMEAADLIHRDEASGDYLFKHVLFRDAIYDRLLNAPRVATHLKVAAELERRSGNALFENAESLAHHFSEGECPEKAFKYLHMAASKSLNVYAVAEAEVFFRKALATYERNPSCAEPLPAARAVVGLLEALMLKSDYRDAGVCAEKLMPVVLQAGETRSSSPPTITAPCRWCSNTTCGGRSR